ncbi:MAG: TetR/AcrR family transcriptional repressor of nem operon [Paraglaciecola psychrophila]
MHFCTDWYNIAAPFIGSSTMARSLEFDRNKALQAAMKLFWCRGYTATSLPDLLAVMGIARSSFYATFSTKRLLFAESLDLFAERTLAVVEKQASELPAAQLPRAFFEATLLHVPLSRAVEGCMMVNTLIELADVDPEFSQLAHQKLGKIEQAFSQAFSKEQQKNPLPSNHSPQQLAAKVMLINYGLRVHSRSKPSRAELKISIDNGLSMLGLAA